MVASLLLDATESHWLSSRPVSCIRITSVQGRVSKLCILATLFFQFDLKRAVAVAVVDVKNSRIGLSSAPLCRFLPALRH
jgi:hypothetical protein